MTDSFVIVDIDECSNAGHKCDLNANCTNTVGSHSCSCEDGFTGNGSSCSGRSVTKLVSLQGTNGQESIRVCECASVRVCECASVRVCECASVRVCECALKLD